MSNETRLERIEKKVDETTQAVETIKAHIIGDAVNEGLAPRLKNVEKIQAACPMLPRITKSISVPGTNGKLKLSFQSAKEWFMITVLLSLAVKIIFFGITHEEIRYWATFVGPLK